jgi:hypothetical protein
MSWLGENDWGDREMAEAAEAALAAKEKRRREAEFTARVWKLNDEKNKKKE